MNENHASSLFNGSSSFDYDGLKTDDDQFIFDGELFIFGDAQFIFDDEQFLFDGEPFYSMFKQLLSIEAGYLEADPALRLKHSST